MCIFTFTSLRSSSLLYSEIQLLRIMSIFSVDNNFVSSMSSGFSVLTEKLFSVRNVGRHFFMLEEIACIEVVTNINETSCSSVEKVNHYVIEILKSDLF